MSEARVSSGYNAMLRDQFRAYRDSRFGERDQVFEPLPQGGAVVFRAAHADANLFVPPFASPAQRQAVVRLIPRRNRHRHFGSMQSSQALAQSIFGCVAVFELVPLLAAVKAECGRPAFGDDLVGTTIQLEQAVSTLGEPRATSVDVSLDRPRVAVECKLGETKFGMCSRPALKPGHARYLEQHCDGSYTRQRGRLARCALDEIGVQYWRHVEEILGWNPDVDHQPCPMAFPYQLVRTLLAACVVDGGRTDLTAGHALVIYDDRNPAMLGGGVADHQWLLVQDALRVPGILRRLSWQHLMAQWPRHPVLDWLRAEARAKFGFA